MQLSMFSVQTDSVLPFSVSQDIFALNTSAYFATAAHVCLMSDVDVCMMQEQTPACGLQQWASCLVTTAVFDVRWNSRFGAALNLFRSLFVIVALGCGAVLFNNDSNRLVLRPIERMLRKVCPKSLWTFLCS